MNKDPLSLNKITGDVKLILSEIEKCRDKDAIAVLIFGIFHAQKENPEITLEEALKSSVEEWINLF